MCDRLDSYVTMKRFFIILLLVLSAALFIVVAMACSSGIYRVGKFNDAVYGHIFKEDMQAVVTSGLAGWEYPIKTASPAEYVIIDIKKDTK